MYPWDGKNIYFIGFMGTGKSKVGREFAQLLGWIFFDTDDMIEERAGKTITEIFNQDGEDVFRKMESDVVAELSKKEHAVVSLGGGAVVSDQNWNLLKNTGLTIRLFATPELLYERISKKSHRPLVNEFTKDELLDRIHNLLAQRDDRYSMAEYSFESKEEVSAKILAETIFETLRDDI